MFESGVGLGVCLTDRNSASVASPVKISTPSKYPSTLGAGPPLRKRPHLAQHTTEPSVTAHHGEAPQGSRPASHAGTPIQVVHYPAAPPPPVQYVTYEQSNAPGHIANVKPPLTLSQVPKRARANRTAMARSLSMNNAADNSAESAFTNRPLARMPIRHVSTTPAPNATDNTTQSPQLFPVGAGNTIYGRRNLEPPTAEPVQPLSAPANCPSLEQQQRSVSGYSQSSRTALDTPALEYSLASPAFSAYAHSPWLTTPGIGAEGATFPPYAFHYPHDQQYSTGLAIQVPPSAQMAAPLGWQPQQPVYGEAQPSDNQEIRVITPRHSDVGQVSHYPYVHPIMYVPPPNMAYLSYPTQPPGYWVVNPAPTTDVQNGSGPPNVLQDAAGRHVSTPFASCSAPAGTAHAEPSFAPMARSVSHGYVPVIGHNRLQPYSMGPPPIVINSVNHAPAGTSESAAMGSTPKPVVLPLSSIGEEIETSAGNPKLQRVRYPAVGKRLRPGPRPKQKRQDESLQVGMDHSTESLGRQCPLESVDRVEYSLTADGTTRRSASPLLEVTAAPPIVTRHHPYERVSSLTKEFLESCYTCFMTVEDGEGAAPCKRYRCNIDDCGRIFPRKSAIHSHVQTHLEDKPYVCTEPDW